MSITEHSAAFTLRRGSYLSFAAFGIFWGTWGASIPRLRAQADITDGQLGAALLFVGAGALPAMLLTGRIIDRVGVRITSAVTLGLLGVAGFVVATTATTFASLCVGLLLIGVTSGSADVAINAAAGSAEERTGKPVITRAHGMFSAFVVLSSLATGVASSQGAIPGMTFAAVVVAMTLAAVHLLRTSDLNAPPVDDRQAAPDTEDSLPPTKPPRGVPVFAIVLVGILGALAFAGENAHQSWAAVFFEDELGTGVALGATAPALFAAVVAITRFSTGGLKPTHAQRVLIIGSALAGLGAAILAAAPNVPVAIVGLAVAAGGTAVLYPTLLGIVSRSADDATRGRATSLLTTVSYLGFLLGPVYVGLWSEVAGLRAAMVATAALGAILLILAPLILRAWRDRTHPSGVIPPTAAAPSTATDSQTKGERS